MTDKTKIIERIQRLLALSTSSNVHEAAAAAAKAQELMARYDIEQASLDVEAGEEDCAVSSEVLAELGSKVDTWRGIIAAGLGVANGAKCYSEKKWDGYTGKTRAELRIIGTKDQANTVRYMFAYLVKEVDRLAASQAYGNGRSYVSSFRLGAASAISQRLKAAAAQTKRDIVDDANAQAVNNGAALVRLNNGLARIEARSKAIEDYARGLNLRSTTRRSASDREGFNAGKVAGESVRLGGSPALGKGSAGRLAN